MRKSIQTYTRANLVLLHMFVAASLLNAGSATAQQELSEFTDPIRSVLAVVSNVIGPALGISGLIYAGAMFFFGETGRPFKIALSCVVGGVLITSAESIWTNLFGGVGVGG
jgi:hypothetical protein